MMELARTSETSVDIQLRTWQYIPEDSELHTRRREKFKSQGVRCNVQNVDDLKKFSLGLLIEQADCPTL
jgi:hypothetical protein